MLKCSVIFVQGAVQTALEYVVAVWETYLVGTVAQVLMQQTLTDFTVINAQRIYIYLSEVLLYMQSRKMSKCFM